MSAPAPAGFPAFESLTRTVERLARGGVECVLGGSGLLAALGLAQSARDWDLTTDAPLERVLEATRDVPCDVMGHNGIHADHKLSLEGGSVEVIVGFSIVGPHGVVRLPSLERGYWRGVPMGSPEVWAVAYRLMGRPQKSELVFGWLRRRGADLETVARLLAEPLPADLRTELERLESRGTGSRA